MIVRNTEDYSFTIFKVVCMFLEYSGMKVV